MTRFFPIAFLLVFAACGSPTSHIDGTEPEISTEGGGGRWGVYYPSRAMLDFGILRVKDTKDSAVRISMSSSDTTTFSVPTCHPPFQALDTIAQRPSDGAVYFVFRFHPTAIGTILQWATVQRSTGKIDSILLAATVVQ